MRDDFGTSLSKTEKGRRLSWSNLKLVPGTIVVAGLLSILLVREALDRGRKAPGQPADSKETFGPDERQGEGSWSDPNMLLGAAGVALGWCTYKAWTTLR